MSFNRRIFDFVTHAFGRECVDHIPAVSTKLFSILFLLHLISCSSAARLENTRASVRSDFFNNRLDSAASKLFNQYSNAADKDVLLALMEAGVVLHTKGDYKKSNDIFKEAAQVAENIKVSATGEIASFVLSDNASNFRGENFERVLIYFYLSLNSTLLREYEEAKRYLRKLDFEQKELYLTEAENKQNGMARFLDAIISEHLEKYEDARVQYKNLTAHLGKEEEILINQYGFALKSNDSKTARAVEGKLKNTKIAFNSKLEPAKYSKEMGELIIINQAGIAARKKSRGKLKESPEFETALRAAVEVAAQSDSSLASNITGVLLAIGEAENPIPKFEKSESEDQKEQTIYINDKEIATTHIFNDYSKTSMDTFNSNYDAMVTKNVASLATKIVIASAAANAAVNNPGANALKGKAKGELCGRVPQPLNIVCEILFDKTVDTAAGAATGALAGASLEPDLRCWSLLPSNFQAKRLFLEPGSYTVKFKMNGPEGEFSVPIEVKIEKGKPFFVNLRSIAI
ncbi:hypothetical protein EHQ58_05945 [Leptospira ognonensis]|uniref:Tetratricopeptide repeat protein n=1 Tax=Leptospira ognonensis TaxID=2484945 RepID=A0A4R9K9E0_9LEPT|nr:hypothetical protein [Leptospira ognonensis]TGL61317.1 hypothetical protein EHQ58_05945 [Leptospira ognonensis]